MAKTHLTGLREAYAILPSSGVAHFVRLGVQVAHFMCWKSQTELKKFHHDLAVARCVLSDKGCKHRQCKNAGRRMLRRELERRLADAA